MRATTVTAALLALTGCEVQREEAPREFVFQAPVTVWQSTAGGADGVWLSEAGGGRGFALLSGVLPDGAAGIYGLERRGNDWGAAVAFQRPVGATMERVGSVAAWPSPIVVSLATGAAGAFVVARTFAGTGWSAPVTLSVQGGERALIARVADLNPGEVTGSLSRFDVVYGVASTVCAEGVELRHRRSVARALLTPEDITVWGAARPVALACGLMSLSAATSRDALAVAWVGGASGLSGTGARDVYAVQGTGATEVSFGAPTVVQRGANRDVSAAALGGGAFLLGWAQRAVAADGAELGLQRGAWARYDATLRAWNRVDTGWFFTRTSPVLRGDGAGEALALGSDGDFATSPLVVRRWTEARAVRTRSAAGSPLGTVRSMSVLRTRDGSVEVIWLEDALTGPGQRVVWTRGVRVSAGDGGV
jgi:hypothetical protein